MPPLLVDAAPHSRKMHTTQDVDASPDANADAGIGCHVYECVEMLLGAQTSALNVHTNALSL